MIETMTFGIELEITLPIILAGQIHVGGRHRGIQIPGLPEGWNGQGDCSIRAGRGRFGIEVVSPVLRGADGIRQIIAVCRQLNEWGAKVNDSCGFHVHIGFDRTNTAGLKRVVHLVSHVQDGIWAATGTKGRERGSFCREVRESFRTLNYNQPINAIGGAAFNRYHLLNVSNLLTPGGKPTIEFRAFSGTTNASKIVAYIRLCLGVVERALTETRAAQYDPKPLAAKSPMTRKGPGMSAMTRMLYDLGWTKGRRPRAYGALADGVEGVPTIKQSKAELRRLAKKYDAST